MTKNEIIDIIAERIARKEGFYKAKSLAAQNFNPGNLRKWGTLNTHKGFAVFPDAAAGWRALKRQILLNIGRELSFYTFFAGQRDKNDEVIPGGYYGYAPAKDNNNPLDYAIFVAKPFKVNYKTVIKDLIKK